MLYCGDGRSNLRTIGFLFVDKDIVLSIELHRRYCASMQFQAPKLAGSDSVLIYFRGMAMRKIRRRAPGESQTEMKHRVRPQLYKQ
mmetsp:Transcript_11315/g.27852  ORF Transcript_11315/g.27852 Transcript_11315/m.27852 type:complete len:86 (-) Transcript_11315:92-349(-)